MVVVVDARRGVGSSTVDGGLKTRTMGVEGRDRNYHLLRRQIAVYTARHPLAREIIVVWRGVCGAATHSRPRSARSCEWRVGTK